MQRVHNATNIAVGPPPFPNIGVRTWFKRYKGFNPHVRIFCTSQNEPEYSELPRRPCANSHEEQRHSERLVAIPVAAFRAQNIVQTGMGNLKETLKNVRVACLYEYGRVLTADSLTGRRVESSQGDRSGQVCRILIAGSGWTLGKMGEMFSKVLNTGCSYDVGTMTFRPYMMLVKRDLRVVTSTKPYSN